MRKLLLLLPLLLCAVRPARAAYAFDQTVTIDHTKVGASDSTNFPFAFFGTYSYLATVGNGGNVQSSSGYDIAFGTNAGCTSLLSWEQESWTAATGAVAYWVLLPTLSHTSNTVIHLCYGDSGVSSFQGGVASAIWDSNFKAVWHLPNGTTLSGSDSTSNAITLTNAGGVASAGQMDGAGTFSGSSGVQMNTGLNPYSSATFSSNGLTLSAWVNVGFVSDVSQVISLEGALVLDLNVYMGTDRAGLEINGSGADVDTLTAVSNSVWHYIVGTADASGNIKTYLDGVPDNTGSQTYYNLDSLGRAYSVAGHPTIGGLNFFGIVDEARISNTPRSADWILAEYNNQGLPCTFYTPNGSGCTAPSSQTQIGGFLVGP